MNGTPLVITLKVLAPEARPPRPLPRRRGSPPPSWIEREMHDLLGVVFEGHPDLRRLREGGGLPGRPPLRRDFDPKAFKESIGERLPY